LTPFRDALQVFSASLRKPARRYGYRGLKIFASLSFRFQDFQRRILYWIIDEQRLDIIAVVHGSRDLGNPINQPWELG